MPGEITLHSVLLVCNTGDIIRITFSDFGTPPLEPD